MNLKVDVKNDTGYNFAGDGPSAGESVCSGSTVMYINRGREDEMASDISMYLHV